MINLAPNSDKSGIVPTIILNTIQHSITSINPRHCHLAHKYNYSWLKLKNVCFFIVWMHKKAHGNTIPNWPATESSCDFFYRVRHQCFALEPLEMQSVLSAVALPSDSDLWGFRRICRRDAAIGVFAVKTDSEPNFQAGLVLRCLTENLSGLVGYSGGNPSICRRNFSSCSFFCFSAK